MKEDEQFWISKFDRTSKTNFRYDWWFFLETLRFFAWPVDANTKKGDVSSSEQANPPVTSSSSSNDVNTSQDKVDWWCDLHRCGLLLQLIEALEKCMYNAYEGAALSLPQLPKVNLNFVSFELFE